MKRQFRQAHTVRYDECDSFGLLAPASFLRYMQEIASLDAEDARLAGEGNWIAKRTVISFAAPVPIHTRLELTTYGIGFSRITAQRGYEASIVGQEAGSPAISARTLWVYLDARGRPVRLPAGTGEIWLPDGPAPQQPEALWPAFPQGAPDRGEYGVRFSDIDIMQHMNNAAYVEAMDNAAWEAHAKAGVRPGTATIIALDYDIEYMESARFEDRLEIQSWFDPFPVPGMEFSRLQQIRRGEVLLARARSRWRWSA
jgi:acyl-CoA thioesterase FadM